MRILDPSFVITASGINSSTASNETVGYALDLSFPIIESILETNLVAALYVDTFDLVQQAVRHDGSVGLRLTNRFAEVSTVTVSQTGYPITATNVGVVLTTDDYNVDYKDGIIRIYDAALLSLGMGVVKVAYTAGFEEDAVNVGVLSSEGLPEWVKSAAVAAAVRVLNTYPSSPANRKGYNVKSISEILRNSMMGLLSAHARPRFGLEFPASSITV